MSQGVECYSCLPKTAWPPTSAEILAQLTALANGAVDVAIAWHLALVTAIAGLLYGWRPSHRVASILLAFPLLSVSILAALHQKSRIVAMSFCEPRS